MRISIYVQIALKMKLRANLKLTPSSAEFTSFDYFALSMRLFIRAGIFDNAIYRGDSAFNLCF